MMENSESQGSELLTQNAEFMTQNEMTQMGDAFEESLSPAPTSPMNPKSIPWGRLIPCSRHLESGGIDLLPKEQVSQHDASDGVSFLGLENISSSDVFNEYLLGRSNKCDVIAAKPPQTDDKDTIALQDWAHAMISNRHCRIYCMLKPTSDGSAATDMDVYIEDTSGNGTLVNNTTHLRRGERRLLHTGDEICLVNPVTLRKKIRSKAMLSDLLKHHSYIFVNVFSQQGQQQNHPSIMNAVRQRQASNNGNAIMRPPPAKRGLVDVRALNNHSIVGSRGPPMLNGEVGAGPSPSSSAAASQQLTSPCQEQQKQPAAPVRRVEQEYEIRDLLGSGTCGQVRRAIHRQTGEQFAVKVIPLGGRNSAFTSELSTAAFQAEVSILKALDHPYVVRLVDVFVSQGQSVHLVMELLQGDLFDRIVKKGKYTENESRQVMRRLLNAIYYLHELKNVVHRDLKPENILCSSRDSDIDVKLTDFGLAKSVTADGLKTFCGTPQYFAPEVLRRRDTIAGRGRYGKEADMWSLGVILYILLSGCPPFDVNAGLECVVDAKIMFPHETWAGISDQAKDLVQGLLMADPTKRASVKDACTHEWILMNDGDTHTHPLDDPATSHVFANVERESESLVSWNRRLFSQDESAQGSDDPVSTEASTEASDANLEASDAVVKDENEASQPSLAEIASDPDCPMSQGTIQVSNASQSRSEGMIPFAPAPDTDASTTNAPGILLPLLSTANAAEHLETDPVGGTTAPNPQSLANDAGADAKQPAPDDSTAGALVSSKPARLSLNARSNHFRESILAESNLPHPGGLSNVDPFGTKSDDSKVSPDENKQGPRGSLITPKSSEGPTTKVVPHRLSTDMAILTKQQETEVKPKKVKKKSGKQKVSSVESRAAELSEDEICSQFSDDEDDESVSSMGGSDAKSADDEQETNGKKRASSPSDANGKRKKRRIIFGMLGGAGDDNGTEVSDEDTKTTAKAKTKTKTKSKATKASSKKSDDNSGGRQTTLSNFFKSK